MKKRWGSGDSSGWPLQAGFLSRYPSVKSVSLLWIITKDGVTFCHKLSIPNKKTKIETLLIQNKDEDNCLFMCYNENAR